MFPSKLKLYYNVIVLFPLIFVFISQCHTIFISFSTPNAHTSMLNTLRTPYRGFYGFINTSNHPCWRNPSKDLNNLSTLFAKPIYKTTPAPRSLIPKHVPLDYENLLRNNDPTIINYNTTLTGLPGINIDDIDDLYGRIYDRKVLMKQLRYFLENDDFNSIPRLMRFNPGILNKSDCELLVKDFDNLMLVRLKYEYPTPENMDRMLPFLVSRYVLQYVLQQDLESRKTYHWLKPGEIPKIPKYKENYIEPKATREKPIHVKDTAAYRAMLHKLMEYDDYRRLCSLRELHKKMLKAKKKKLINGLRYFQRLKPFKLLSYRRKVANKVDIDRVSPFLFRPMRCTDKIVEEYTGYFEEAVNKEDLATACRLINRYSRRIVLVDKFPLLKKFMDMLEVIQNSGKYHEKAVKRVRNYFKATVRRHKFLIRYNEPMMILEAGKTLKDMYEEQLEMYRKERDKRRDAVMKKMGIDMDKVRDFSDAYGPDWIPILYPKEFEEGLQKQREKLQKLRNKAEWMRNEAKKKYRFQHGFDLDEDEPMSQEPVQ